MSPARPQPPTSPTSATTELARKTRLALSGRAGYVPLSPQEERLVGRRAADGDEEARWTLVMANVNFARSIAARYLRGGVEIEDLVGEGIAGLHEAARRFDPERRIKFVTYAAWWVKRAILRYLRTFSQSVHVPKYKQHEVHEFWRTHRRLAQELGRTPDLGDLLAATGVSAPELAEYVSLSQPSDSLSDDGEAWRRAAAGPDPEDVTLTEDAVERVRRALATLDGRERDVVLRRFGLDGRERCTLAALGAEMGLTKERVRQIEKKACARLRERLETPPGPGLAA